MYFWCSLRSTSSASQFLTDEAGDCGKGANSEVSQVHYFFTNHGMGEKEVFLLCDNCTGQNKLHDTIALMACHDQTALKDLLILSGCWAYHICT